MQKIVNKQNVGLYNLLFIIILHFISQNLLQYLSNWQMT